MTALANDISRALRAGDAAILEVAAGANVRQGSLCSYDAAGRVAPAVAAQNVAFAGVALRPADNRNGAAGALSVLVRRTGLALFAKTGTAVPGKGAYAADDNTVTDVAGGRSKCGRIVSVDGDDVWVDIGERS